ncbi:hypothetical protein KUV89_15470 [Marinobacter hydrocarbonoclasticus]|nr:hypothetical protein [Marinobacter nauticus]
MDALLHRWGWALATANLLGLGMALVGLYFYLSGTAAGQPAVDPGLLMGLGVVMMMPQTLSLMLRHWQGDERS